MVWKVYFWAGPEFQNLSDGSRAWGMTWHLWGTAGPELSLQGGARAPGAWSSRIWDKEPYHPLRSFLSYSGTEHHEQMKMTKKKNKDMSFMGCFVSHL